MNIRLALPEDIASITAFNQAMALETEGITLESEVALAGVTSVLRNPALGFYLALNQGTQVFQIRAYIYF